MSREQLLKIDLFEIPLWGFERVKDPRIVWGMFEAIQRGVGFRPVPVYELKDGGGFHIARHAREFIGDPMDSKMVYDGGHNRALAHLIAETPLAVDVIRERHIRPLYKSNPLCEVVFFELEDRIREREPFDANYTGVRDVQPDLDFMKAQLARAKSVRAA